jgi:hypothetical protein
MATCFALTSTIVFVNAFISPLRESSSCQCGSCYERLSEFGCRQHGINRHWPMPLAMPGVASCHYRVSALSCKLWKVKCISSHENRSEIDSLCGPLHRSSCRAMITCAQRGLLEPPGGAARAARMHAGKSTTHDKSGAKVQICRNTLSKWCRIYRLLPHSFMYQAKATQ